MAKKQKQNQIQVKVGHVYLTSFEVRMSKAWIERWEKHVRILSAYESGGWLGKTVPAGDWVLIETADRLLAHVATPLVPEVQS